MQAHQPSRPPATAIFAPLPAPGWWQPGQGEQTRASKAAGKEGLLTVGKRQMNREVRV